MCEAAAGGQAGPLGPHYQQAFLSFKPPAVCAASVQIEGLSSLTALRKMSIQSNRLESISGLEHCTALEELYLSHNGIRRIEV